ncbi:nucleoside-diphosphate-sugar epimerase [Sphingomonas sp. PP-CE-1A-559]|uniref:NAD(P)H-binding protein n=1 Tax=Sphingomonas sp. PP-CE-1A-559 TaxID=2135657 RepID=UPI0010559DC2|nr:NAD(P)H-binding protein [Sphingomonas sp. PP-CE-1A-559]TCP84175.1 nucleoside-diphosphate-sugar epimerase [Sphingomonas sp. PP-CE-1A-559]
MAKVFIIGAAGKVGSRLAKLLAAGGHTVLALHRKPEQADTLATAGATPVLADLAALDANALAVLIGVADTVVFAAGAGGAGIDVTKAIDGRGLETAVTAAQRAGVARFVLVSAFPDALRDGDRNEGFENYSRVKKLADAHLVASGLDYVILRPGTLSDDAGTGRIRADLAIPYGTVSRDDVAATLAAIVERPDLGGIIIELTKGDQPIATTLDRLAGC